MSPVIRLPDSVYDRLAKHSEGFDTPARVIEKLLDQVEGVETPPASSLPPSSRDTTKYVFNGQVLGKGRLVLAVVTAYVEKHSDTSFDELLAAFPRHLQGSMAVFDSLEKGLKIYERTERKRYFIDEQERIELGDGFIAVCAQWNKDNIQTFIRAACDLGFEISKAA